MVITFIFIIAEMTFNYTQYDMRDSFINSVTKIPKAQTLVSSKIVTEFTIESLSKEQEKVKKMPSVHHFIFAQKFSYMSTIRYGNILFFISILLHTGKR